MDLLTFYPGGNCEWSLPCPANNVFSREDETPFLFKSGVIVVKMMVLTLTRTVFPSQCQIILILSHWTQVFPNSSVPMSDFGMISNFTEVGNVEPTAEPVPTPIGLPPFPGKNFIIPMYFFIFFLSFFGNLLVILTLVKNRRMRTVTNVLLLNLVS